jgi:CheY-like chemotaxis protein
MRVVVMVDDDPDQAVLIEHTLSASGHQLLVYDDLDKCIEHLKSGEIDEPGAMLLDLGLPRYRGTQSLERIIATSPSFPVIVFSGNEREGLASDCLRLGATEVVRKRELHRVSEAIENAQDRWTYVEERDPLVALARRVRRLELAVHRRGDATAETLVALTDVVRELPAEMALAEETEELPPPTPPPTPGLTLSQAFASLVSDSKKYATPMVGLAIGGATLTLAGAFGAILWWVLGTAGIEKPPEANHELLVPEPAALPLEAPDDEAPPE